MLLSRAVFAVMWCWLVLAWGCDRDRVTSLALHRTHPDEIEPGGELYILGSGFPVGRNGAMKLRGITYRPGLTPKAVEWDSPVHALSSQRVATTIDPLQLEQLGNRGTFVGEVVVRFATPDGGRPLEGRLHRTQLDLAGITRADAPPRDVLRHRAEQVLAFVGLQADEGADDTAGVKVMAVAPGSPAAESGLLKSDVLLRANGVSLHSLADLAPARGVKALSLLVERKGQPTAVAVRLSLSGFELAILDEHLRPVAFLLIALLWFFAFYGPFTSPSLWIARVQSRIRYGESLAALGVWDQELGTEVPTPPLDTSSGKVRRLLDVAPAMLASSLLVLLGMLDSHFGIHVDAFQLYLAMAALLVWLSQRPPASSLGLRFRRAQLPLAQMGLMALIILSTSLATGARSLHDVVEQQGALPLRWGLFTQPGLLLLFPVFVLLECRPAAIDPGPKPWIQGLTYAGLVMARLLVCGVGAAVFLGGWASHELSFLGPLRAHLLGTLLFALKAYGVALLLHAARALSLGQRSSPWSQLALCAGSMALTISYVILGLGEDARLLSGTVMSTAAALVVTTAGIKVLRSKAPMGSTPKHVAPFL